MKSTGNKLSATTRTKLICALLFVLGTGVNASGRSLQVVSYNVENLFHPKHDTVLVDSARIVEKDDYEWTPDGEGRWSYSRYYRKVESIARVLTNIGEWEGVDIAGLQEVENAACLRKLCYTLRRGEYDFVHYESPDPRGIDVALVYKKARVDTINSRAIRVADPRNDGMRAAKPLNDELKTRDILYVCARVDKKDTLHLLVCHLPSQKRHRRDRMEENGGKEGFAGSSGQHLWHPSGREDYRYGRFQRYSEAGLARLEKPDGRRKSKVKSRKLWHA